jgi:aspartyl-tRNA(Asn)/glutamyl-tRNA(Gln) amidotransferase subunit B
MEEGSLRVDANVSARRRGETALGTKTEVKNMNSFSGVERALAAEFARQCAVLDSEARVTQQTMLWDAVSGTVRAARTKEESHDYRYFPEPDLPPLALELRYIDEIHRHLPELPAARRRRFHETFGLGAYDIEVLTADRYLGSYFEELARLHGDPKEAANWVMGELRAALNESGRRIGAFPVRPSDLAELLRLVRDGVLTRTAGKKTFGIMAATGERATQVAAREGLVRETDDAAHARWLEEVIAEHPTEAKRLAAGERKLLGVLVGYVMKKSKGRADPKVINQLLSARFGGA